MEVQEREGVIQLCIVTIQPIHLYPYKHYCNRTQCLPNVGRACIPEQSILPQYTDVYTYRSKPIDAGYINDIPLGSDNVWHRKHRQVVDGSVIRRERLN